METKKIKKLFLFIGLLLYIPFVQQVTELIKIKPLGGAITAASKPEFSVKKWLDGDYQSESESYLNEKFGFRNHFIRLNNQVAYLLYNKAKANGVIIGKDGYLFEENYINAYYGSDFIGTDSIDSVLLKVQYLQQVLKKKNIDLILVFNPGKAAYYPGFIPDDMKQTKGITNYKYYSEQAVKLNLNVLDLKAHFSRDNKKFPYPLFPKCGIHWSTYCETLAEDTLMKYIGALRKTQVPEIIIDSLPLAKGTKFRDADLKNGMNLIWASECGELAYPVFHVVEDKRVKLNCITISDSFYWGIYERKEARQLFAKIQFWYYYYEFYSLERDYAKTRSDLNLKNEIEAQQVILIMATDQSLPNLGWGFIQEAYSLYKNNN